MKVVACSKIRSSNKLQRKIKIGGKDLYVKTKSSILKGSLPPRKLQLFSPMVSWSWSGPKMIP